MQGYKSKRGVGKFASRGDHSMRRILSATCGSVRGRAGARKAVLRAGPLRASGSRSAAAGSGPTSAKATAARPRGRFRPVRLWWRADRLPRPRTSLPMRRIGPARRLVRRSAPTGAIIGPFGRSANEPGDRLWRDDGLYDLFIEIDHNTRPRVAGRGSAVFIHVARPGFAPTAGCVALRLPDLQKLVSRLGPKTRIMIHN